jgi:diaminopimelate decarboxylase
MEINGTVVSHCAVSHCAGVKTNGTKNFIVVDGSMSALLRWAIEGYGVHTAFKPNRPLVVCQVYCSYHKSAGA